MLDERHVTLHSYLRSTQNPQSPQNTMLDGTPCHAAFVSTSSRGARRKLSARSSFRSSCHAAFVSTINAEPAEPAKHNARRNAMSRCIRVHEQPRSTPETLSPLVFSKLVSRCIRIHDQRRTRGARKTQCSTERHVTLH